MIDMIYQTLEQCLDTIAHSYTDYVQNPDKDFTRNRVLTFKKVILMLLKMGGQSLSRELLNCQEEISNSAFVQSRYKIKVEALKELLRLFVHAVSPVQDLPILAIDGSDINIPCMPDDPDSYFPSKKGGKAYSLIHLNALYDLNHQLYYDALVQKRRQCDERQALIYMMASSPFVQALVIADRGYESYNLMAHFQEKSWYYLIRIRDGKNSLKQSLDLPETDCFDLTIRLKLTRRQTKETKELFKDRNHYKFVPKNQHFDYLSKEWDRKSDPEFYELSFRIVRLEVAPGIYETLVTNTDYDVDKLKSLYASRWGIETSFRELKYTIGLISFHAKKMEGILQEIFAHFTLFNFSKIITEHIEIPKKQRRYVYKVNYSDASYACRLFLLGRMTSLKLETYIQRHLIPIRPERKWERKIRTQSVVAFNCRIA